VETESSNWRELSNLVLYLCDLAKTEALGGYEIYMFTDNSTAEAAFWKSTSVSPRLFKLVLQLKRLELEHDLILHVIHISGKRMIAQGTDGLSCADHSQGVMQGKPIQEFIPLHLNSFEREPKIKSWLERITAGLNPIFLCHNISYNVDDVVKGVKRVTSVLFYSIVVAVENRSRDIEMMSFDSCD
jgi:hypothetical protein